MSGSPKGWSHGVISHAFDKNGCQWALTPTFRHHRYAPGRATKFFCKDFADRAEKPVLVPKN